MTATIEQSGLGLASKSCFWMNSGRLWNRAADLTPTMRDWMVWDVGTCANLTKLLWDTLLATATFDGDRISGA